MRNTFVRRLAGMLGLMLMLAGCAGSGQTKYTHEFFGTFDTLIQIVGYAVSQDSFTEMAARAQASFERYHKVFDQYHDYEAVNNLKVLNDQAGIAPVVVEPELLDLIVFCLEWQEKVPDAVNIAMGPVLSLWHDARAYGLDYPEEAALPDMEALKAASGLCDASRVVVDPAEGTVYLPVKGMSLDLGAVAKGYACGRVADELEAAGYSNFVISGGGNIVATGAPQDGARAKWGIAIQNPDANPLTPDEDPLDVAYVNAAAVVTSGDNQRTYTVDGVKYHHLIDPATLMPATHFRAVTVMTAESGMADFLSTALFVLPYEKSRETAEAMGVDALWVLPDGTVEVTDGMLAVLRDRGGASNK